MRRATPLLLALPLLLAAPRPASAAPRATEIVARLLATTPHGPTRVAGHASAVLAEGELGVLELAAGVVSDTAPRCLVSTVGGRAVAAPLTGPGYRWRVLVELVRSEDDLQQLGVRWSREGRDPSSRDASASEELDLRLAPGESRHLDYAEFAPLEGDSSCAFDALVLEIEPRLRLGDPAFAGRDLDVEVWFARSADGRREEFSSYRLVAPQGESIVLPIEPLEVDLDLGPGSAGRLRTGGRATITGWRTGSDTLAIRLEAVIQHRFDPGAVKVSSGEGSKLYQAKLGETVEIELPPLFATLIVTTESLELAGSPADGITIEGETARVDLRKLAGATGYSLLLRVTDGG